MARILINDCSPTPERLTGISVYTWKIVQALIDHGAHDYVLATNRPDRMIPEAVRAGVAGLVRRRFIRNETLALFHNGWELPGLMRAQGCSAIFHPQPTAMVPGGRCGVAVVHDLYRVTHPELNGWKQRAQWRMFIARGLRDAGALIAVSASTRDATVAAYPSVRDRISVVHEASPIAVDPGAPPLGPPPVEGPYALVVANITRNKNVGLALEALGRLAARGVRPKVVLIGRDEVGELPAMLAAAGPIDLVRLGSVPDDVLRAAYAHARVYVNTSLVEGFCLPILEAHAFGVPVICSDLPVLHEVGGEGALFVDPRDPDALAAALETLFFDEAANRALRAKAAANATRFSWKKAALETEAVLERVMR